MTDQPKPCPFCGNIPDEDNPMYFSGSATDKWGALVCCGAGPEVRTGYEDYTHWRDEAIGEWNNRPIEDELIESLASLLVVVKVLGQSSVQDDPVIRRAEEAIAKAKGEA